MFNIISHPGKPLVEHLWGVTNIALADMPLTCKHLTDVVATATKLHDIGKANAFFQKYIKETNASARKSMHNDKHTHHAKVSAVIALYSWLDRHPQSYREAVILYMAIEKHHGNLKKPRFDITKEDVDIMKRQLASINPEDLQLIGEHIGIRLDHSEITTFIDKLLRLTAKIRAMLPTLTDDDIELYMDINYVFSVLINADKLDAGIGEERIPTSMAWIQPNLVDLYRLNQGWLDTIEPMSVLRNELYDEAIIKSKLIYKAGVYSLNVPTGSGKTLTATSIALKLRDKIYKDQGYLPRIIYALPFTSIIEQNYKVMHNIGIPEDSRILLKHHHLSEVAYNTEEDELQYTTEESSLLIEAWQSEMVFTTFVQLFHALISNKNRMLKKNNKTYGSIIILDEIQAVPLRYWELINRILRYMVEKHNTYIIMVTASKPTMIDVDGYLVTEPQYYFGKMKRVNVVFEPAPITMEDLVEDINTDISSGKSVLAVLNTKKCVKECYNLLTQNSKEGVDYIFLTTDIVPSERLQRIKDINNSKNIKVVISTQMIEAGVDIDLDVVYRDIAPFDSIMQSAGRCNRHFRNKKGTVYVFCLDNGKYAYQIYDQILVNTSISILRKYKEFEEHMFLSISDEYFNILKTRLQQNKEYLSSICRLNYNDGDNAIDKFRIIEDDDKSEVFIEVDEDAAYIFREFRELGFISDRKKRKEAFLKIKNRFLQYIIPINNKRLAKNPPPMIGELGYVSSEQRQGFYDMVTGYI